MRGNPRRPKMARTLSSLRREEMQAKFNSEQKRPDWKGKPLPEPVMPKDHEYLLRIGQLEGELAAKTVRLNKLEAALEEIEAKPTTQPKSTAAIGLANDAWLRMWKREVTEIVYKARRGIEP